jgi:hypothetical protein
MKVCVKCNKPNRTPEYKTCLDCRKRQRRLSKIWTSKNRDHLRSYGRNRTKTLKLDVISHYSGGKNICSCCGEPNFEFLEIHHTNGGGTKHRNVVGRGRDFYAWIVRNNYPDGFTILCANCNKSLGTYGYCPHTTTTEYVI